MVWSLGGEEVMIDDDNDDEEFSFQVQCVFW
jgi:hypothetical protein